MIQNYHKLFVLICLLLLPAIASAVEFHISHNDPVAPVILGVTGILFVALIGRFSARKLGFPSVIGELIMGIVVVPFGIVESMTTVNSIDTLAEAARVPISKTTWSSMRS